MKKNTTTTSATSTAAAGLVLAVLALILSSCASTSSYTAADHRAYVKTPDRLSSKITRALAKSNPWTAKAAFWGNWGGSGNEGGLPIDEMDEGFRRHDSVYVVSHCGKHLKAADRELVVWLENLDEDTLNPAQLKFRKRAIKFLNSPMANFVGKPPLAMLRKKEHEGCYFTSVDTVKEFFNPTNPGFPDSLELSEPAATMAAASKPARPEPASPKPVETTGAALLAGAQPAR